MSNKNISKELVMTIKTSLFLYLINSIFIDLISCEYSLIINFSFILYLKT